MQRSLHHMCAQCIQQDLKLSSLEDNLQMASKGRNMQLSSIVIKYTLSDIVVFDYFFLQVQQPPVGQGLLIRVVSRSHTTTHHSQQDSSGRVISSSQRPLPDNTKYSQQTDIHAPGGIRTQSLSRRAAADLRLRPHGHWDQSLTTYPFQFSNFHTHNGDDALPRLYNTSSFLI